MYTYYNRLQPALQNLITTFCSVLPPEIVMHDDAYIGGRSENNIECVVHMTISGGRTKQLYIFCHITGFMSDFSQFHSSGTYLVL